MCHSHWTICNSTCIIRYSYELCFYKKFENILCHKIYHSKNNYQIDNIDTLSNILQNLSGIEITKVSTTNKLFYTISNNEFIWLKKLNSDFFHNGIFSLSTAEQAEQKHNYKELYQIYYRLHTNFYCTMERLLI